MYDAVVSGIAERRLLSFRYQGRERVVMPARFGPGHDGRPMLHAYQVRGASSRGNLPEWRNFYADDMADITLLEEGFGLDDPPGFNPRGHADRRPGGDPEPLGRC